MTVNKAKRMQTTLTIRQMLVDGHSYNDIMAQLGGTISERTFWRYIKRIFAADIKNLERATEEQMMRQVAIHVERANNIYRKLEAIASDTTINAEYRLNALNDMFKLSRGLIETYGSAPAAAITMKKKLAELSDGGKKYMMMQQQRYTFPATHIFDPNNKSPYTDNNMILRPGESPLT